MPNKSLNTEFLDKAIGFAVKAHAGTERRGKGFPYVVHVLEAVEIASTMSSDQEILAAAALHDTVEDTDVTLEDIRKEFGERVAKLVESESEVPVPGNEKDTWHLRKSQAMERLKNTSRDGKIVALGDKLSNTRAIWRDYKKMGDDLWNIFHVTDRKEHEWHYRGLLDSLSELGETFAYQEMQYLIDDIFGRDPFRPRRVNMNDYNETGGGYTSISYTNKNGRSMIKLFRDFLPKVEQEKEIRIALKVYQMGISTPKPYGMVTDGNHIGTEFELVQNKRSFARIISEEPEKLEYYSRRFARALKILHNTECNTSVFSPAIERFTLAVQTDKFLSEIQRQKLLRFLNAIPKKTTCIHGDSQIGNIVTNGTKDFWIDLADFGHGDPCLDIAVNYFMCNCLSEEATQKLYHISCEMMKQSWKFFVDEYFGNSNEETFKRVENQVKPLAMILMLRVMNFENRLQERYRKYIFDDFDWNTLA